MSTFAVEVVPVHLEKHPNADSLSIVRHRGYQVLVRTNDWEEGTLGAYIPPDSVVPDTEDFKFLNGHNRIKVKKLRGIYSMGMLVAAPEGAEVGDDVADQLGITHYEPPIKWFRSGKREGPVDFEEPPEGFKPHYDVENFYRYPSVFQPGEWVIATEKIHGANARFTYQDDRFWAGSRNQWKKESDNSLWWVALRQYPGLMEFLKDCPGTTAYGEVYGCVQDLTYGHKNGAIALAVFDIWQEPSTGYKIYARSGQTWPGWVDHDAAVSATESYEVPWVPEVYRGMFQEAKLKDLSVGKSLIEGADNMREGIVVIPERERYVYDLGAGRLQLKFVSPEYLEKAA